MDENVCDGREKLFQLNYFPGLSVCVHYSLSAGVQNENILLGKIKVGCPPNFSIGNPSRHVMEGI